MNKPIPEANYPCASCGDILSWPADHLHWSEQAQEWVCEECWEGYNEHWKDGEVIEFGVSLAEELKRPEKELREALHELGVAVYDPDNSSISVAHAIGHVMQLFAD